MEVLPSLLSTFLSDPHIIKKKKPETNLFPSHCSIWGPLTNRKRLDNGARWTDLCPRVDRLHEGCVNQKDTVFFSRLQPSVL